ncbi:putative metal-binding motif-containing protein [Flagellimonas iocasae]|uniref:Metal-binding motif-containing protein n=1 Tax=Flagellimonas iocasae TaxID=2055905 RepID=A0ABW4XW14_9FLAO
MRKNNFFGLLTMVMGFGFLVMVSCSKDDSCENRTCYLDKDLDNFGAGAGTTACKPPSSASGQYVLKNGDANDEDPNVNPGCTLVFYIDDDGDGFPSSEPFYFCENPDPTKYTDEADTFDCNDNDTSLNPDVFITYYPDTDGDGFGDPNGTTMVVQGCKPAPANHVTNSDDCDDTDPNRNPEAAQITYYYDGDKDGYGIEDEFDVRDACDPAPENFTWSLQAGDCNDNDDTIHPGAEEISDFDGIDSNCDGIEEAILWGGEPKLFSKAANADWVGDPQAQDIITENVVFTRSTKGFVTNIAWWQNEIGQTPTEDEDLEWESKGRKFLGDPVANVGEALPSGGPNGVRWAILSDGGDTEAWSNFDMYGTLGDPTNFYSFNNIIAMCSLLNLNEGIDQVTDAFGIIGVAEDYPDYGAGISPESLVEVRLGVWLVEENIYFTLRFTELSDFNSGGVMSYSRSTPDN